MAYTILLFYSIHGSVRKKKKSKIISKRDKEKVRVKNLSERVKSEKSSETCLARRNASLALDFYLFEPNLESLSACWTSYKK